MLTNWDYSKQLEQVKCCTIHKKGDEQLQQNCHQVSLFPVCSKILERIVFNPILEFLEENNILRPYQSGFHSSESCQSKLLSTLHDIHVVWPTSYTWSESKLPRYIKTFDKVWHEGLLFKPEYTGILANLLSLLKSFLNNRFQRVVLNGHCSNWSSLLAGVPWGSILGPLLCLYVYVYVYIYIYI